MSACHIVIFTWNLFLQEHANLCHFAYTRDGPESSGGWFWCYILHLSSPLQSANAHVGLTFKVIACPFNFLGLMSIIVSHLWVSKPKGDGWSHTPLSDWLRRTTSAFHLLGHADWDLELFIQSSSLKEHKILCVRFLQIESETARLSIRILLISIHQIWKKAPWRDWSGVSRSWHRLLR